MRVANFLFRGRSDLVLLMIDSKRVAGRVRYENLEGGVELFPHVYSALSRDAVVAAEPLTLCADGTLDRSSVERCISLWRAGHR